jgi:hypothetical protein
MGANLSSIQPEMQNDKKPFPPDFHSKIRGDDGFLTFYGLPTPLKLWKRQVPVNRYFRLFSAVQESEFAGKSEYGLELCLAFRQVSVDSIPTDSAVRQIGA